MKVNQTNLITLTIIQLPNGGIGYIYSMFNIVSSPSGGNRTPENHRKLIWIQGENPHRQ